jgi:hypothetical protein
MCVVRYRPRSTSWRTLQALGVQQGGDEGGRQRDKAAHIDLIRSTPAAGAGCRVR